jgi:hypothetical protein
MTTSVIADNQQINGCPVDGVKVSEDITPSGDYEYLTLPARVAGQTTMVTVTTDAAILVQLVADDEDASDGRAIAVRPPAGGLRDFTIYARKKTRLAYKTLA